MHGEFTLILGPMASGKSGTLITQLKKYEIANKKVVAIQPEANVRDEEGLASRVGLNHEALRLQSLRELAGRISVDAVDVIGVDEIFMFEEKDAKESVSEWLSCGKVVVAAALDISAMGRMPDTVKGLLELAPDVVFEKAVCKGCDEMDARFTQIIDLASGEPIREGLPDVVPDDGTYGYRPVCRSCFKGWDEQPA